MNNPLSGYEPVYLWNYFTAISAIPRESGHESQAVDYIENLAKQKSLKYTRDAAGNIILKVPATKGLESAPPVILQGHIDMVCVKTPESKHDFRKDGIELIIHEEWLKAKQTTLGADNLAGVAAALALLDDPEAKHPPLEILVTVDEEVGMTGAIKLDAGMVSGRILINLDSEDPSVFYIGCAGGGDCVISQPVKRVQDVEGVSMRLRVSGLKGGHSGLEIHLNSANATKLLTRVLYRAINLGIRLSSINGGTRRNVIPSEAIATFTIPEEHIHDLKHIVDEEEALAREEYLSTDPHMKFQLERVTNDADDFPIAILEKKSSDQVIRLLMALPHGVLAMSRDMEKLVETSNNVGIVTDRGEFIEIICTHRSSVKASKIAVRNRIIAIAELTGASVAIEHDYPGWKPNINSKLLKLAQATNTELFGNPGTPRAIHAGLETGLLLEKIPNLDIISFGPAIKGAHSVEEKINIKTVGDFYKLLKALLVKIAKEYK